MTRRAFLFLIAVLGLALAASAVVPRFWSLRSFDDFLRGTFEGVSVSAGGRLTLAPREDRLDAPGEDFYLSFLMTPEGAGYLGTGHGGKIYRISKDGKSELYFQTAEMDVTCLALDRKGVLYAGTSPNGKIYRVSSAGKGEEFFNPAERYVWDLLFTESGNLLAAVGESGGIYEINPQGEGRVLFKAEPNHILCLRFDRNGDIIAGSGGNGLVFRIAASGGKAAVIFETPYDEVRSLAFDLDGRIFASAGGAVKADRSEPSAPPVSVSGGVDVSISVSSVAVAPVQATAAPVRRTPGADSPLEPGAIFRLGTDGLAKRIWSSTDEMVYSLFWSEGEKRLYFGTGPKGRFYALDLEDQAALILQSPSEQISTCVPLGSRIYLLANNPSGLILVSPESRLTGEYIGPVWDARMPATWGRISWQAGIPQGATLQLQTRSGNSATPGPSWSEWSPPYGRPDGEPILSPKARFLQIRALFRAQTGAAAPVLSRIEVPYLQANAAPAVTRLELLPPNEVFLKPPELDDVILGLEKRNPDEGTKKAESGFMVPKKIERQGFRTIVWEAEDANDDVLVYAIALRRDGESAWRAIESRWTEKVYAFNTVFFPDGIYELKVTASDALSNPVGGDTTGEKTVGPLVVDNAAPEILDLKVVREGGRLSVSFRVEDGFSAVRDVRALIRPGDWHVVFPADGLADSRTESYAFEAALPAGADNLLTILVRDAVGNTAAVRRTF